MAISAMQQNTDPNSTKTINQNNRGSASRVTKTPLALVWILPVSKSKITKARPKIRNKSGKNIVHRLNQKAHQSQQSQWLRRLSASALPVISAIVRIAHDAVSLAY